MTTEVAARLAGRRIAVTGAGSGMGMAAVKQLAAEGATVLALDVRAGSAASSIEALGAVGTGHVALDADVADEESIALALRTGAESIGGLDGLVTCAAVTVPGATDELPLDLWDLVVRVNLTGTFLSIKHALPHLLQSGAASIVTIASSAAVVACGRSSSYDASKGGVLALTKYVAAEYAGRGVRANCLCPGIVSTNFARNSQEIVGVSGDEYVSIRPPSNAPLNRRGEPSEIAAVVAFLCSGESSFMTGSAVMVDGGYTSV